MIDPTTKMLYVGFIFNGPGCQAKELRAPMYVAWPQMVNSSDDGLTWSAPYSIMLNMGAGKPAVPVSGASHVAIGPTKGLTVTLPNGNTRLMFPGEADWSASVFSDDHGGTWQSNANNRSYTLSPGEMDWTVCSEGTECPPGMKYLMVNRAAGVYSLCVKWHPLLFWIRYCWPPVQSAPPPFHSIDNTCAEVCSVASAILLGPLCKTMCSQFSADGVVWGKQIPTVNAGNIIVGQGHAKPGVVAVPGAFISSQTLVLCARGQTVNTKDSSCGTPGLPGYHKRVPTDVVWSGMCLMISKDGIHWSLFKKTWPFGGMYTTAAGLTFDAAGAALTYGIVFAGGSLPVTKTGNIYFMNFTAVHPNGTMDSELAAAIAKL